MARVSSCVLAAMLVALSGPVASAADLDSAIGLIVAGEVEKAAGVQIFDIPNSGPLSGGTEAAFWTGTSGKLSLPLGENLSIQTDVDVEYNDQAFSSGPDEAGLRFGFQGGWSPELARPVAKPVRCFRWSRRRSLCVFKQQYRPQHSVCRW